MFTKNETINRTISAEGYSTWELVEGELTLLALSTCNRFVIVDPLTEERITCFVNSDLATSLVGKKVFVYGRVYYDKPDGKRFGVKVTQIIENTNPNY